ncbi:MAG: glycosyl hydrolase, partial [Flammeovirgaceae bacterium]
MKFIPIPVLLIVVFVATQQVNSQQEKPPAPERSQVVYPNLLSIAMGLNLGTPRVSLQPDTLYTSYDLNSKLVKLLPDGFENKINSFYLPEGYMAVFAENNDGSGESSCFVALDGAIAANLPARLRNKISFVRYLRVNNPNKRGSAQGADKISSSWYYNWGSRALSFERQQYVPMTWGKTTATDENVRILTDRKDIDHLLSFNEPDHKEQANIPVDTAVARYKIMLKTGLRIGSPVTTQDNFSSTSWRAQFMNGADAAKLRVDYITLHWYDWGNETITGATDSLTAVGVFNRFVSHIKKARATYPGKPIWVTEYNANRKRTSANVHRIFMKLSTAWMNESAQNYIERYVYFFPPELPALNSDKSPTLLGEYWKNISSPNSFSGNIINDDTIFKFKLAT